jgi:hypothetical protein
MHPRLIVVMLIVAAGRLLGAGAAGPNPGEGAVGQDGDVAGLWLGLWHGVITPITLVISLFGDGVSVCGVHGNGY